MVRTDQGGSILSFIIVGSVLAVLLVGGAYFVRRQLAVNDGAETVITDNSSRNGEAPSEGTEEDSDDTNTGTGWNNDNTTDEVTKDSEDSNNAASEDDENTPTVSDLPETGPADVLLGSIMIGSIVGTGAAYQRSRRLGSL